MSSKSFLDVDDSLFNSTLRLQSKNEEEKEFDKIINSIANTDKQGILLHPYPGICMKVKNDAGEKTFINVCVHDDMPAPEELSQEELMKTVMDENLNYVIPLSIGEGRMEVDKGGVPALTYDVLINKKYFEKCQRIKSFMVFTTVAIIDGVSNKFNKSLVPDSHVVLKNRKVMGTLQPHRIENRKPKTRIPASTPLIEEISSKMESNSKVDEITEKKLEYVILKNLYSEPDSLTGLFKIPSLSANDVSVDVSEDRVIVEDRASNSFVDVFLPNAVDQQNVKAYMDSNIGILRLNFPLLQC